MIFFTSVSITLGIILKEPAKTWIASALFLILCSLFIKADFGEIGGYFFPKLTNSWQRFFAYDLDIYGILQDNLLLVGYTILFAVIGIYKFNKTDIG